MHNTLHFNSPFCYYINYQYCKAWHNKFVIYSFFYIRIIALHEGFLAGFLQLPKRNLNKYTTYTTERIQQNATVQFYFLLVRQLCWNPPKSHDIKHTMNLLSCQNVNTSTEAQVNSLFS